MSFVVLPAGEGVRCTSPDPRGSYMTLAMSVGFTVLLALGTTAPAVVFVATTVAASVHVAMVADPPDLSVESSAALLPALVANAVAVLLPTLLAAGLLYKTGLARTLSVEATAAVEKTLFWLVPFWVSVGIPLPLRSGSATINLAATVLTAVAVAALVTVQTRTLYREGRLVGYLAFYAAAAGVVGVLALLVLLSGGLALQREGWVVLVAGLLLPLTGTQTRVGMVGQGVLMGVFVGAMARGGGVAGLFEMVVVREQEVVFPTVLPPVIEWLGKVGDLAGGMRVRFKFLEAQKGVGVEGISVLVNDVERYRGWVAERALEEQVFAWTRAKGIVGDEYFRFGFLREGGQVLGYSEAGTWFGNGSWSQGAGYW
ncbi:hypothetical protein C8A05DRAFT_39529 [Staphylotrichum tortipilum]|uniref:Uncharacterized protein n=1 Tax=Staphylotrichum tortipilum TaxID=2831512 RepID=A0AAN6RMJ9_9PEZI|nr:hypothetical protein C8A05DRAFT_39529 [Staphylotrichum longicolle]